ncbi:MAG: hypothetical protein HOV68_17310 [Streptomycetaceae bacterium]|nr:hypothetical protein [Streptomycetaceae bacterium]
MTLDNSTAPAGESPGAGGTVGTGGRHRLGTGEPPVVVTVMDRDTTRTPARETVRDAPHADSALDGRILDTAEVRALTASGLRPPERGKHMAINTTGSTGTAADAVNGTDALTALQPAAYDDPHLGSLADDAPSALTRARVPRADQDLRERTALTLPGWLAGAVLLAAVCAVAWAVAATGHIDSRLPEQLRDSALLDVSEPVAIGVGAGCAALGLVLLLGMFVVPSGTVRVLSRFGRYKGTVRRTGLVWAMPLRRRRRIDVRLRHWRSRPMDLTDRQGTPVQVMVLIVWQVRDSARARFAVRDHEQYLRQQIEATVGSVTAGLPCDSFTRGAPSLRDSEHIGEEMTRRLAGAMTAVGVQVYSVQVLHIDYAPQVAESMLRRRIASLDAATRTAVLDDVVDTVSQAVDQFTRRALVRLDEDGRTEFIRDLTVAMYSARGSAAPAARD